jgi:hypothetical protein
MVVLVMHIYYYYYYNYLYYSIIYIYYYILLLLISRNDTISVGIYIYIVNVATGNLQLVHHDCSETFMYNYTSCGSYQFCFVTRQKYQAGSHILYELSS